MDCHMAWLQPFVMGLTNMIIKAAAIHVGALRPRPRTRIPRRALPVRPRRRPFTLLLGPPQALMRRPPATPPTPKADWTLPRTRLSFPERLRIMGARRLKPMLAVKLATRKMSWRPRRLGRARM